MALEDNDISTQLAQTTPYAPTAQDADMAKSAATSDAAQQIVNASTSPRPLGQPDASGWRQGVDLKKDAEASKPNVPAPGSFGSHLSNALEDARNNADAAVLQQPGSWSKLMVGATMDALVKHGQPGNPGGKFTPTGVDSTTPTAPPPVQRVPFGQPVMNRLADLAGPGRGAAGYFQAANQRQAQEQKDRVLMATSNAQMLHQQALTHKLGSDAINEDIKNGNISVKELIESVPGAGANSAGSEDFKGKTSDELTQMIRKGQFDPSVQTAFPTGKIVTGKDANGLPIERTTYSVITPAKHVKVTPAIAAKLNEASGSKDYPVTDNPDERMDMSGVDLNHLIQKADNALATKRAFKLAEDKATVESIKAQTSRDALNIWNNTEVMKAMAANTVATKDGKPDPSAVIRTLDYFQTHLDAMKKTGIPNFINAYIEAAGGEPRIKTLTEEYRKSQAKAQLTNSEMMAEAMADPRKMENNTDAYDAVIKSIIEAPPGSPNVSDQDRKNAADLSGVLHDIRKNEIDLAKAKAEGKTEAAQGYQGNPDAKTPEEFLASLKPGEQSMVKMMREGRLAMSRIDFALAKKSGLFEAVERAYPGEFDSSKIGSYKDAYVSFTSGKDATTLDHGAKALTHLARLKEINDANPIDVHNWAAEASKQYNTTLNIAVGELMQFYHEPATNETVKAKKDVLSGMLYRGAAISEQGKAMTAVFNSLKNKWKNASPSKVYEAQMPDISLEAKKNLAYLDSDYKAAHPELAAQQKAQYQGKIGVAAGGKTHYFNTQAEADSFKKLAGIQ